MKKIIFLLCALILAAPAAAIELSLEENKAQRGNIGYIDMQRLFKTFPDTLKARENFEELVRQAEDQLNLRKAEILRLRHELSQLKIQREFMAKTPIEVPKQQKPVPVPKPPEPVKQAAPNPVVERMLQSERYDIPPPAQPPLAPPGASPASTMTAPGMAASTQETDYTRPTISNLPGFGAPISSQAAMAQTRPPEPPKPVAKEPLIVNIPGVSTAPIVVQPPQPPPQVAASTQAAVADGVNPALVELDAKIAVKTKDLASREVEFKEQQSSSEKNLLDMESRKTEVLLGKIHRVVQEVARKEGISVVVDKTSILYGHDAVDLTEKVMKALKGS